MSILPTWPIAAGTLLIGLAAGAWIDHSHMQGRIDQMVAASAEQERKRALQYAEDEATQRDIDKAWAERVGQAEQEKQDEIARVRAAGAAAFAGVRNRPDRQPTPASGMRDATPSCTGATGAQLSRPDSEFLIGEAARADEQRAALSACYSAYETIRPQPQGTP